MIYNKLLKKLESYTNNKTNNFKKFVYVFLSPYFFLLEKKCKNGIWDNLVIKELITNDKVFEWLNENEFEFRNNVFKSSDLIENHEFFNRDTLEESKLVIKEEFVRSITNLFKENISFDVENYVNLMVETELKAVYHEETDKYFYSKIYTLTLQFCRQYFYEKSKKYTKIWFVIFSLMIIIIFLLFLFL